MCSGREVCVLCVEESEGTLCAVEGKCAYSVLRRVRVLCVQWKGSVRTLC